NTINASEQAGASCDGLRGTHECFSDLVQQFQDQISEVEEKVHVPDVATLKQCTHCCEVLLTAMNSLRQSADALERLVERDLWPMPTYQELLSLR
ncbi:MAG: hypothetical protein NXI07_07435, partial [bacterium]|nr:hypothetical protein [bacterium]